MGFNSMRDKLLKAGSSSGEARIVDESPDMTKAQEVIAILEKIEDAEQRVRVLRAVSILLTGRDLHVWYPKRDERD